VSVLEGLEGDVQKTLQSIQKGLNLLDDRRASLLAPPPAVPAEPGEYVDSDEWDDEAEDAPAPART
jgi:hypothetical protein